MGGTSAAVCFFRARRRKFLSTRRHTSFISFTTFTSILSIMFLVRENGETAASPTRRPQRDVLSSIVGAAFWITPEKRISLLSYTLTSFGMPSATSAKKRSSTLISHTPTTILSPLDSSNKLWMSYIHNIYSSPLNEQRLLTMSLWLVLNMLGIRDI